MTALGSDTLENNSADFNTAVGASALHANTTGKYNTGIGGYGALGSNTTGSNNIARGSNNIDIGNPGGAANEANTIRLGYAQTRTFIAGIRG